VAAAAARVRNLGVPVLALGGGGYAPEEAVRGWARVYRKTDGPMLACFVRAKGASRS